MCADLGVELVNSEDLTWQPAAANPKRLNNAPWFTGSPKPIPSPDTQATSPTDHEQAESAPAGHPDDATATDETVPKESGDSSPAATLPPTADAEDWINHLTQRRNLISVLFDTMDRQNCGVIRRHDLAVAIESVSKFPDLVLVLKHFVVRAEGDGFGIDEWKEYW